MGERKVRAVYMRGGTSRALMFRRDDLPPADSADDYAAWRDIFLGAIGSPDPNGRQLNGIGGGISSLSKVAVIGAPTHPEADVDYTFGQVGVFRPTVGYRGNCGNISSAVGPFAVDEGIVAAGGDHAAVRIHNTNTGKIIIAEFALEDGRAVVEGAYELQGVAGTGAPIRLTFRDPGGASTGRLLPTGSANDRLPIAGRTALPVSMVDAANPVCFLAAQSLGLTGREAPDTLAADADIMKTLRDIRVAAAVAMTLAPDERHVREVLTNLPLVALVAPPDPAAHPDEAGVDIIVRMVSSDQPHKASPLTGALCVAAAAHVPGSVVADAMGPPHAGDLVIRHPSGRLEVAAEMATVDGEEKLVSVTAIRTARRIMEGDVYY
ncbi:2-methylaconitate cis-trans isomerase PrpF family protein [Acuticoccus mangrovi]|uniref:PrpF family protein n=1 Tax=Acuticoccus mangrovi TaxID=2796142 RepID=A0A934MCJ7_9HYPH|nr:PrpF family protein [Acuticoccus mangrovi]